MDRDQATELSIESVLPATIGRMAKTAVNRTSESLANGAHVDPIAYMAVKDLQLRAKAVVEGFYNGLHRSPFHGFSVEFAEYRPYTVGDDPRGLDWKLYARTDRYFIKRFEDETNRRCYLVLDQSRSMNYGSLGYTKIEYARTLVATLAYFLTLQRDSVGLLTFDDGVQDFVPARNRPGHLRHMMVCLSRDSEASATDLAAPLHQIAAIVRKRGLVILVSDMLAPLDDLRIKLGYLRSRGHEVILLRTLDPAERTLQLNDPAVIEDLESGRELYIDPATVKEDYERKFTEHADAMREICSSLGVDYREVLTNSPLQQVLYDVIRSQQFAIRGNPRGRLTNSLQSDASSAVTSIGGSTA